jgi:hypothetical protein
VPSVKLPILVFLLLTTFTIYLWTRSFWLAALSHLSLLLGTVALGYLDAFFAPPLILALWALEQRRLGLFAFSYTIACLIKWQPVIIAPFIAIHLWGLLYGRGGRQISPGRMAVSLLLPAALVIVPTVFFFTQGPIWRSIVNATSHTFLSGNALNFNWILTHWLHVSQPGQFGGLVDGQATFIRTSATNIVLVPRLLFAGAFATATFAHMRREKTFEQFVRWSLFGYWSYFMLNTGVHENHLFLAVLLSIVLFSLKPGYGPLMLLLIVASNLNLLLFYGVTGVDPLVHRVVLGVDCALVLSILNVAAFTRTFIGNVASA